VAKSRNPEKSIRDTNANGRHGGKSILVTGGAGFLGYHLCKKLLEEGHTVFSVDNFISGQHENVELLSGYRNFTSIEHDITEPLSHNGHLDEIYNLACPASPPIYQKRPIHTLKTNIIGSLNMLEMAQEKGAKILQASTSEVYGDPEVHPQPEHYLGNVNTIGPRSCYDEGKRAAETLFSDFRRSRGVDTRIARLFNTYGPMMSPDDGRVVSNFIIQALQDKDITVYGSGTQTRSFCYADDTIEALVRLMNLSDHNSQPINIGNPEEFTVRELADIIIMCTGSKSNVVNLALPIDDPRQRCPDISVAKQKLNWSPKVPLLAGIEETIRYLSNKISNNAEQPLLPV